METVTIDPKVIQQIKAKSARIVEQAKIEAIHKKLYLKATNTKYDPKTADHGVSDLLYDRSDEIRKQ